MEPNSPIELLDEEDAARTTLTLLASLSARMATLYTISGADAVGSITAGLAAYGREVAQTEWGMRMRGALERSRVGENGEAIWQTLRIADWASTIPPTPVMQQMRNDIALVAADDLADAIAMLPIPTQTRGARGLPPTIQANFLDFTLGLWAYAKEVAAAIEALAEPTMDDGSTVRGGDPPGASGGPVLR